MRVITKRIKVYKFKELSEKAKDRARYRDQEADQEADGWGRNDEYLASLKALAEHFGCKLADWSIDWSGACSPSYVKFRVPEAEEMPTSEIKKRLDALGSYDPKTLNGNGDCVLTGTCYDEDAIDGLRIAFMRDGERDLNALMQAAFKSWIKSAHADYEYAYSDEGFAETCEANNWEFDENGEIVYTGR